MIKPSAQTNKLTTIEKISAVSLDDTTFSFSGYKDSNRDIAYFLMPGLINVGAAIKGASLVFTLRFYESAAYADFSTNYNKNLKEPLPVWLSKADFSSKIDNSTLKASTLLYHPAHNRTSSDIVSIATAKTANPPHGKYLPVNSQIRRFSNVATTNKINFNPTVKQGLILNSKTNSNNLEYYLKTGNLALDTLIAPLELNTFNPMRDGMITNTPKPLNSAISYAKLSPVLQDTNSIDSNYVTRTNVRNYGLVRTAIDISIPVGVVSQDLVCVITVGDDQERPFSLLDARVLRAISIPAFGNGMVQTHDLAPPVIIPTVTNAAIKISKFEITNSNPYDCTCNLFVIGRINSDINFSSKQIDSQIILANAISTFEIDFSDYQDAYIVAVLASKYSVSPTTLLRIRNSKPIFDNQSVSAIVRSQSVRLLAYNDSNNQRINIDVYLDGLLSSRDIIIKRRERTIAGTIVGAFEALPQSSAAITGSKLITYFDSSLRHDTFYEYAAFKIEGMQQLGMSSFVFYRDAKLFSSDVGSLTVSQMELDTIGSIGFNIKVEFSSVRLEQTLTALQKSTDGTISTSNGNIQIGNYIDNIKNNREKLSDLFRVNLVRQDINTGNEYNLGNFPAGAVIIDAALLRALNVPLSIGPSRYIFRLLQRNAITIFNEITETITDQNTLSEFTIKIGKFLNPLNLVSNMLPSTLRLLAKNPLQSSKLFPADDFLPGFTGITSQIFIGASLSKTLSIVDCQTWQDETGSMGAIIIDAKDTETIGHIIAVNFAGMSYPLGFYPIGSVSSQKIADWITKQYSGPRTYSVYAVDKHLGIQLAATSAIQVKQ